MKITKSQLRKIIKEELTRALSEQDDWHSDKHETLADLKHADRSANMQSQEQFAGIDNDLSDELAATFYAPKDDGTDYSDSGDKLRMVAEMLGVDAPEDLLFSEDFDAIDAFKATGKATRFSSPMESGNATRGTFKGQDAVLVYVMGNTTLFVEGA